MAVLFLEYPNCSTCRKAKKWLESHQISYEDRNIKEERPKEEELHQWIEKGAMPVKKFFNTSGQVYKTLGLKDKLPTMEEHEQVKLLSSDGMLVKRPIIVMDNTVLVGFKEEVWEEAFSVK